MHTRDLQETSARRFAAVVCLGAFLLGSAGLLPSLAALAARLDASHAVRVTVAAGEAEVILHHSAAAAGVGHASMSAAGHRHGVACTLLCAGWADSGPSPDHILRFQRSGAIHASAAARELAGLASASAPAQAQSSFKASPPSGLALVATLSPMAFARGATPAAGPPTRSALWPGPVAVGLLRSVNLLL